MKIMELTTFSFIVREKLVRAGIVELADLAVLHKQPQRCFELTYEVGVSLEEIRWMVSIALFYPIEGIGLNHSSLLLKTGIDSIEKLAKSNAKSLFKRMEGSVSSSSQVHFLLPSVNEAERWIEEAQTLIAESE